MDKYFIRDFFIFFTYFMAIWCGICIEKRSNGLIYENNHSVLDDSNELYSLECPCRLDDKNGYKIVHYGNILLENPLK